MSYSESSSDDVRSILLPDSRVLSYAIYGNTAITAPTIFYFYPYPDSHIGGRIYDTVARDRGIRIIVPDRPGIGRSTFKTWRTIAQWPDDVLQVADAPGVKAETFGVFAVGGGAPYALACCAKIPSSRLKAAGIISGVYPASLGTSSYSLGTQIYRLIVTWIPYLIERSIDSTFGEAARDTSNPQRFEELMKKHQESQNPGRPPNSKEKSSEIHKMMVAGMRAAFQGTGSRAVAQDMRLAMSDWGFALGDINMGEGRLVLWHRRDSAKKPLDVVEKAHALLRGSELRLQPTNPDIGDAEAMERMGEAFDTLLEMMKW
ncbi:Alpha/Beta hydrolase protein [Hypoxylon rubiginosum]|uniref:Alpha/Beta hydrolase protein n=1 Tax=Hypoxylon rubiginosum TaxID=110542 RepID=A0ACB9YMK5_9PEZI|nr:Alpha/Beta hydrolase protein [Hypoxylon rubiginosum]